MWTNQIDTAETATPKTSLIKINFCKKNSDRNNYARTLKHILRCLHVVCIPLDVSGEAETQERRKEI